MNPSRRELLMAFLGASAVAGGCGDRSLPALPDGDLVGPSEAFGHRLRDGWRPTPTTWVDVPIVIVGGGVAGLAAAWRLTRAGFNDFVLLELERDLGGTSKSGVGKTGSFPWGAHYVPAPLPHHRLMIELLREMGVVEGMDDDGSPRIAEEVLCRDPGERVYFRGRWYEGLYLHVGADEEDERQLGAFRQVVDRWVNWRDGRGRRAFTLPVADCSDDPEVTRLDRQTMNDWLKRHDLTSPRLRWMVDYACRDDYGATVEHVSAWAGLFYFVARTKAPGDEAQPFLTWPEGNGHLVRYLAKAARGKLEAGWAASEIVPVERDGRPGVDVTAVNASGDAVKGFHARSVICALPQAMARYAIRDWRTNPPAHVKDFEYGAWVVANVQLRDRPRELGFPLAWDNVLYETPSLGYVVNTHQLGVDHGPATFTWYYPLCDPDTRAVRTRLQGTGWRDWAEIALADLGRPHPAIRSLVERLDVMRWGHAMVRPRPGFQWGSARRHAALPHRGIHFASADLSGVPVFEEAFHHGVRAADEALANGLRAINR